jgi:tetratricopeptide (TPR) repeat protein
MSLGKDSLAQAQSVELDSLQKVTVSAQPDSVKLLALNEIAAVYYRQNLPDSGLAVSARALTWSQAKGFAWGVGRSLAQLGAGHYQKKDFQLALDYFQQALQISTKHNDLQAKATSLNNLGLVYSQQNNYTLALIYYQQALQILEGTNDTRRIGTCLLNLGNTFRTLGNYVRASECYQRGLKLRQEAKDRAGMVTFLNNLGSSYRSQGDLALALDYYLRSLKLSQAMGQAQAEAVTLNNLGNLYKEQGNLVAALDQYNQSLALARKRGLEPVVAANLNNLGELYYQQGDYDRALAHFEESLKMKRAQNDRRGMAYSLNGLAEVYQKREEYELSAQFGQQALALARQIKAPAEVAMASRTLYQTYRLKADHAKALEYLELNKQVNDSLFSLDKAAKIASLENTAELERKQREIALLNQNQAALQKDQALQALEIERQRSARLAVEKRAEADRLLALARQAKDQQQARELYAQAEQARLEAQREADKLQLSEARRVAENRAQLLELEKVQQESQVRQTIIYWALASVLVVALFVVYAYSGWRKALKAKQLILEQKHEIQALNDNLEALVRERTRSLVARNQQLATYAHYNAHVLRQPVANILGLYHLYRLEPDHQQREAIFQRLNASVEELDKVVREIQRIVDHPDHDQTHLAAPATREVGQAGQSAPSFYLDHKPV